jgi:hypothetical protein
MASCSRCGIQLGLFSFSSHCESCKVTIQAEEQERQSQMLEAARLQLEELKMQHHNAAITKAKDMKAKIQSGRKLILFESVYLPVDSVLMQERVCDNFTLGALRRLGLDGWEIVAVAPRTLGLGLTNVSIGSSSGETWGAGIGGNIFGVHVILKLEVTKENCSDKLLFNYTFEHLDDLNDERS